MLNQYSRPGFFAIIAVVAGVELWLGRVMLPTSGELLLWYPLANGPGNSQHLTDWYTFSHLIHGFIFYWLLSIFAQKMPVRTRLFLAIVIEGGWEILENSPLIIERYRSAIMALDYFGDSVSNSIFDVLAAGVGFLLARRWPVSLSIGACVFFELLAAYAIRDNLTLNVLMLLVPLESIKLWQLGAG